MTTRGAKCVAVAVALLSVGAFVTVVHAAPITGSYKSTDLGQPVTVGRWTEGFVSPPGLPNQVGNGVHGASWDGANLGDEWELAGPIISSTTAVVGNPALPSGTVVYHRVFDVTGATLTLKDPGPWWNAAEDGATGQYVVDLTSYEQTLTVTYVNYQIANASSIETFAGTFQGFPGYELLYGHTLGAYEGHTLAGTEPTNYPEFLPSGFTSGGAWGVAEGIRFDIIPEPATMGLLGFGVIGLVLHRRKKR